METNTFTPSDVLSFANMQTRVMVGTADVDAPYTVMEMRVGTGGGAPAHRSLDEDKTFVVLDGALDFLTGDTVQRVSAGTVVTVARGDIHGFTNIDDVEARMLLVAAPARHDAFFRAMAALPQPHDVEAVRQICERYRQVIVGM